MKKSIVFTLLALVALASCMREAEPGSTAVLPVPTTRLTINSAGPGTKTYMEYEETESHYVPYWNKDDAIGVFVDEFDSGATDALGTLINGNADGEDASFTGDVPDLEDGNHTAYAYYPARAFYGTESEQVVDLEIPEIQFPSVTSFDHKADLLVSEPISFTVEDDEAGAINASFRRVCAILRLKLTDQTEQDLSSEKVKSVRLDFAEGNKVTGAFRYSFANGEACEQHLVSTYAKPNVTADYSGDPINFGDDIFLMVNPGSYKGALTVTVLTERHEIVKTYNKIDWELNSGKVRPVTVKLSTTATIERVYFKDNFDWIANYWDGMMHKPNDSVKAAYYTTAYKRNQYNLDPVLNGSASGVDYHQPNVWSNNDKTVGAAFSKLGYVDLCPDNKTMYTQENYLKWCASGKQSGLELPLMDLGEVPVNVTLSFDFAVQQTGQTYVVVVLNRGVCANSGVAVSDTFTAAQILNWERQTITLIGLTNASRICIRPNVSSYNTTGQYRFWLDNIKVTEAAVTPAPFPITWDFAETVSSGEDGVDYHMEANSLNGSYVFSNNHYGKIFTYRTSASDVSGKTPTLLKRNDAYDVDKKTPISNEGTFLHYGIGEKDYWEFDVYNVKNSAGTYEITYKMASSASGAKHFRVEYTLEDTWPTTPDFAQSDSAGEYQDVSYTYATVPPLPQPDDPTKTWVVAVPVKATFHLDAIETFKTLKVRAIVVTKVRCADSGTLSNNTTATNRLFGTPTISFAADE